MQDHIAHKHLRPKGREGNVLNKITRAMAQILTDLGLWKTSSRYQSSLNQLHDQHASPRLVSADFSVHALVHMQNSIALVTLSSWSTSLTYVVLGVSAKVNHNISPQQHASCSKKHVCITVFDSGLDATQHVFFIIAGVFMFRHSTNNRQKHRQITSDEITRMWYPVFRCMARTSFRLGGAIIQWGKSSACWPVFPSWGDGVLFSNQNSCRPGDN